MNCLQCGKETSRPKYCSRPCGQKYKRLNEYGDKYTLKYRCASPRNFLLTLSKKKAERRNLTIDYLMHLYDTQDGKCALSGRQMTYVTGQGRVPTNMSIDRIDPSIGYEEGNIQLVCIQANKMKMELSGSELLDWCESISNHLKGRK